MLTKHRRLAQRLRKVSTLLTLVLFISYLAGCSAGQSSGPESNSLLVWVDPTRLAPVQQYQKMHPEIKMDIRTVDRAGFPEKVTLFNRTKKGWPDVIFAEPPILAQAADKAHDYPADLKPYVSQEIINGFSEGALAQCYIDGKLICLRNDLAQNVLWYNKKLMDEFGYEVPKTWEEYQALGLRVAKEHPGYIIGAFGDATAMNTYFWGSGCPLAELTESDTVRINAVDPNCKKVADLVDPLLGAGVLPRLGPFDGTYVKLGNENKILMMPAASWFGEYVFKTTYKTPEGELAAAAPPSWEGADTAYTGAHGGSAWAVSRHSKNPQLAADLVIWLTTSMDYQPTAPTYPAYKPAAEAWEKTISTSKFYAENPFPVLQDAAEKIDPRWSAVRYDLAGIFNAVVLKSVLEKKTVASALPEFQKQLEGVAKISKYTVVK